jgi:hypothetical protein
MAAGRFAAMHHRSFRQVIQVLDAIKKGSHLHVCPPEAAADGNRHDECEGRATPDKANTQKCFSALLPLRTDTHLCALTRQTIAQRGIWRASTTSSETEGCGRVASRVSRIACGRLIAFA